MLVATGSPLIDAVLSAFDRFGYAIAFAFALAENVFVVGTFTPGETMIVAAGFVAAGGGLNVLGVLAVTFVGTIMGSTVSYALGRRAGRPALVAAATRAQNTRLGRFLGVHEGSLDDAERYFARYGSKTVFLTRFAWGLKNVAPVVAGASKMPLAYFELWTAAAAAVYAALLVGIGWFVGDNFSRAVRIAGSVAWAGLAVVLLAAAAGIVFARRAAAARESAREAAAEADAASKHAEEDS